MDNNRDRPKTGIRQSAYPGSRPYFSLAGGRRKRRIPEAIKKLHIPLAVLEATSRAMQCNGQEDRECYVWWGGYYTSEGDCQVVTALIPDAETTFGRIHLDNRQLSVLHTQLRDLDQVLVVELHTHPPGAGGQNDVDAAHPASTHKGFITIVVPDFAFPLFYDLRDAHVYEYQMQGNWRELSREEISERFVIEETAISVEVGNGSG